MKQVRLVVAVVSLIAAAAWLFAGCTNDGSATPQAAESRTVEVSDDGVTITFPAGYAGLQQITSHVVKRETATVSVLAPSRVVASILPGGSTGEKAILFDSPDLTSLYAEFRQAKANVDRTTTALRRVTDMYNTQGATAKDLTEAQTDAAGANAAMAEAEGKLLALNFNPRDLDRAVPRTVWLISDVSDTQLGDVQKGEDVDVYFSAYPDKKFQGKAVAVGDVLDPATRTVKVRVVVNNPSGKFLPGMFARVDYGDPVPNVIVLPLSSVVTVEGNDYVFVERAPHVFERRQIATRYANDKTVVAAKGVSAGERVVTGGAMLLKGLSFGF